MQGLNAGYARSWLGRRRMLLAMAVVLLAPAAAEAAGCDTRCLMRIADQYRARMLRHDPAGLPIAQDVVAVENAQPTPLGSGSWQSIKAFPVEHEGKLI